MTVFLSIYNRVVHSCFSEGKVREDFGKRNGGMKLRFGAGLARRKSAFQSNLIDGDEYVIDKLSRKCREETKAGFGQGFSVIASILEKLSVFPI
jgi:hypothetical protein